MKKKQRAAEDRKKYEESVAACTDVWLKEILPEWHLVNQSKRVHNLWWKGLPPKVRGTVWKLAVGNELQLTKNLYYIMVDRAKDTLRCCKDSHYDGNLKEETRDNVRDIRLDVLRTFPHLCIFQECGPYHEQLLNVLGAYASYRPDVGYVQGMSFLTAVLLLNLEPSDAFILLSNLLHQPCQRAFFRMDADMVCYLANISFSWHLTLKDKWSSKKSKNLKNSSNQCTKGGWGVCQMRTLLLIFAC